MTARKRQVRKARIARMNRVLDRLFPNPKIALRYGNNWELLVAVMLSAQCTDERVNLVTAKLFKKYPALSNYLAVDPRVFERDIHSCGFFRSKTRAILGAARAIEDRFSGTVPKQLDDLLSLPGVARKTANVVLSNAYGIKEGIAVDTHVRRFAIRFDLSDFRDPVRIERDLTDIVPRRRWSKFNHQLVFYGREICPARPHDCASHPLTKLYPKAASCWPRARM